MALRSRLDQPLTTRTSVGGSARGLFARAHKPGLVSRFDRVERMVHWATATLVGLCMATALALAFAPISAIVGRRSLVREVHVISGLLLLAPILVGFVGRWGTRLRADIRALDRFDTVDRRWLRSAGRDPFVKPGKFHPGQKLNAAASAAALVMLYATGIVLKWFGPFPLNVRQGSTFVHDWTAFLFTLLVLGHVVRALSDPDALRGMVTGRVDPSWAARKHPRWRHSD